MSVSILKTGTDSDIIKVDYAKNRMRGKKWKRNF